MAHSRRRPPSSHQSYARIIGRDARWRALKGGTARPSRQTAGARIPRLAGVETPNPTRPAADTCGPAAAAAGAAAGAHSTWRSKNLLAASTADQSTRAQVSQSSRRAGPPVGCQGGGGARHATRGERAVAAPVRVYIHARSSIRETRLAPIRRRHTIQSWVWAWAGRSRLDTVVSYDRPTENDRRRDKYHHRSVRGGGFALRFPRRPPPSAAAALRAPALRFPRVRAGQLCIAPA